MVGEGDLFRGFLACAGRNTGASERLLQPLVDYLKNCLEEGLLVAASGGPDSQLLLHLLHDLSRSSNVAGPVAFHLDHSLREDSGQDASLVAKTCSLLDCSLYLEVHDVVGFSTRMRMNLEAAARFLRYREAFRAVRLSGSLRCCTGHHGADYAETILMKWIRSSGRTMSELMPMEESLPIWSSMRKTRKLLGHLNVARPLLLLNRSDIENLISEFAIPYHEDSTNADGDFQRNRIRLQIQTLIQEGLNPASLWSVHHDWPPSRFERHGGEWAGASNPGQHSRDSGGMQADFVRIPFSLWQSASSVELAGILRAALRGLGLEMISRSSLHEILLWKKGRTGLLRISNLQCEIWSAGRDLWVYPVHGAIQEGPEFSWMPEQGAWCIRWLKQQKSYGLLPDQQGFQPASAREVQFYPFLQNGQKKKGRVKTIYQKESLPPPVRRNLPVILDERGWLHRICLSFLGMQDRVFFLA